MMKTRVLLGILLALSALALAGCGGGSGNSDESRIRGRYRQYEQAVEDERIDNYMLLFSPDYLDNGQDYVDVRNSVSGFFDQLDIVNAEEQIHDIRINGDLASVFGTEIVDGYDTFNHNEPVRLVTDFNDIWIYESGNWYLYGNQRSTTTAVKVPFRHSKERIRAGANGTK
jgi:hypothetical protein